MRPNDRATIVTFSDDIRVALTLTGNKQELKQSIQAIRPGGASRVYDAVSFTLSELLQQTPGRKAVLLFSDGVDNASRDATFDSTLQLVQRTEAILHPIQLGTYEAMRRRTRSKLQLEGSGFSEKDYLQGDLFLHQLAALSSTGVYPVINISDLERVVADIVDELHNEYSIGYYPQTKGQLGEVRKVEIRVRQPQLTVRSRGGYVVGQSGLFLPTAGKSASALQLSDRNKVLPIPREEVLQKPSMGSRWICKGPGVQTDLAVVKEAVVSQCPKSRGAGEANAWLIKKPGPKETVCKGFLSWNGKEMSGAPIPYGYVVTGEASSSSCSRGQVNHASPNAWLVQTPSNGVTVCKGFLLPRGFVTAGERYSSVCPAISTDTNAWVIRAK